MNTIAPYGGWESPLSAKALASSNTSTSSTRIDQGNPSRVYWLETRPTQNGRHTLLSKLVDDYSDATMIEHLPGEEWNVRSSVHEYGGGAYAVHQGVVVFTNWKDQGVYVLDAVEAKVPRLVCGGDGRRYADFVFFGAFVVCVCEDHRGEGEAVNTLVAVRLSDGVVTQLFAGTDFVSSPVLSADNTEIAFCTWQHPDMNWDATKLRRATISASHTRLPQLSNLSVVASDTQRESVYQPRFDSHGRLHFISDRANGFWNPHYVDQDGQVRLSLDEPMEAEFAPPEWVLGTSTFQAVPDGRGMVVTYCRQGQAYLGILDVETRVMEELPVPGWTVLSGFQMGRARSGEPVLVLVAGGPLESPALYTYYINGLLQQQPQRLVSAEVKAEDLDPSFISVPREIAFPTRLPPFDDGSEETVAYAYYYAPTNPNYAAPEGELPPLLVMLHGGPTSATHAVYQSKIQYWTSRGFAVADVNYGGSTGYGRAYRERLYPQFGKVDVQDCCAAALHLAALGLADRRRLSIMGGSAGGFTTLACLVFRPEVFAVGASLYGISDLEVLAQETHKFEAQYPVHLVGPYPENRQVYHERSPLFAVEQLACPVVFLQGLEDKIVPPNQATLMVEALKRKGVRVALVEFEGEQHGFRKAESIVRALEAQLYFFGKVLGFEPADCIEPVPIHNNDEQGQL
ncbi:Esterase lipase thioesterase active site [Kickxella alabastrina]|uniref:Esterase lipase thioesterase active site n=1 Tax=Kickxella alabastrina TaxID=61397 RepID=A0ACC1IQ20_9FUNG|nr:Esterase lipase thioesterase active site [Kickxella alabastrina]